MTNETRPDPEAKYRATEGFVAPREPGGEPVIVSPGKVMDGTDPLVIRFYPEKFELDPVYLEQRDRAEMLALARQLAGQAEVEPTSTDAATEASEATVGLGDLTRESILAAKRAKDAEGHNSMALYRRLNTSPRTLIRARHRYGLVPLPLDWQRDYLREVPSTRGPPGTPDSLRELLLYRGSVSSRGTSRWGTGPAWR